MSSSTHVNKPQQPGKTLRMPFLEEVQLSIKETISHYEKIVSVWKEVALLEEIDLFICADEIIKSLKKLLKENDVKSVYRKAAVNERIIVNKFMEEHKFGEKDSTGKLFSTSIYIAIDSVKHSLKGEKRKSSVFIKPPQSGATSSLGLMKTVMKAYANLCSIKYKNLVSFSLLPNNLDIKEHAENSENNFFALYGCLEFYTTASDEKYKFDKFKGETIIDPENEWSDGDLCIHKNHHKHMDAFVDKIMGVIEEQDKDLVNLQFDECHNGTDIKGVFAKTIEKLKEKLAEVGMEDKVVFTFCSATPYEAVNSDFMPDMVKIPFTVADTYTGPRKFEGYSVRVISETGGVKQPPIFPILKTHKEFLDWDSKFKTLNLSLIDTTSKPQNKIINFAKIEHNKTSKEMRNPGIFKEMEDSFEEYEEHCKEQIINCCNVALDLQVDIPKVVALRVSNVNAIGDKWYKYLKANLSSDIELIKCYRENKSKKAPSPIEAVNYGMENGKNKIVIIHTAGGRMGVPFPTEAQVVVELTSGAKDEGSKHIDTLQQGYFGRICGHEKGEPLYISCSKNIARLEYFLETGYAMQEKVSARAKKKGFVKTSKITDGNVYRNMLIEDGGSCLVASLDRLLKKQIEKHNASTKKANDRIETDQEISSEIINLFLEVDFWNKLENGEITSTNRKFNPIKKAYPGHIAETIELHNMLIATPVKDINERYKLPDDFIANRTIGLRYMEKSFARLDRCKNDNRSPFTKTVSVQGNPNRRVGCPKMADYQIVWDLENGEPRFVSFLYRFREACEIVGNNGVPLPTDKSVFSTSWEG